MGRDGTPEERDGEREGGATPSFTVFLIMAFILGPSRPRRADLWSGLDCPKSEQPVVNKNLFMEAVMVYEKLSTQILDAVFTVHGALGSGLLEQCYHNALYFALQDMDLPVGYNVPYIVKYKGRVVGEYYADLVVDNKVILELKSVKALANEHCAQLLNYLHISGCKLGYLLNFQNSRMEFKRMVLTK